MSAPIREPYILISFSTEDSAPLDPSIGKSGGFFDDKETLALLEAPIPAVLLTSGTYGEYDVGISHRSIAWLAQGGYERRLLPFVPTGGATHYYPDTFRMQASLLVNKKRAWQVIPSAIKTLREEILVELTKTASAVATASLPLPTYCESLLPRLLYVPVSATDPLEAQLQCWFAPAALRARWVRVWRVILLLKAVQTLARAVVGTEGDKWPGPTPMGIAEVKELPSDEEVLRLLAAYQSLGLDVRLPEGRETSLPSLSKDEARAVILCGVEARPPNSMPSAAESLEPEDEDGLVYGDLYEDYGA